MTEFRPGTSPPPVRMPMRRVTWAMLVRHPHAEAVHLVGLLDELFGRFAVQGGAHRDARLDALGRADGLRCADVSGATGESLSASLATSSGVKAPDSKNL